MCGLRSKIFRQVGQKSEVRLAPCRDFFGQADGIIFKQGEEGFGGIILIRTDAESIQSFTDNDPFVKSGIQEYEVTEFTVFDRQDYADEW